ncbi:carboxymuconolactone decarboxylase family protein [[Eubacterium] cellulosolvens]
MTENSIEKFKTERDKLNVLVMKYCGKNIKRFYGLDTAVYQEGALDRKTKQLIGLAASMVLRCDDCVKYHMNRCYEEGVGDEELEEALAISLIVGGSITIPTLRRGFKYWDELKE